jgi:hypothetical protein
MPKLTQAQAISLLKAVGVPDVEIVAEAADFNLDETTRLIDTARRPIIRTQIEDELRDSISRAATGRIAGTFKSALAREFGVTRDELDQYDSGKEGDMIKALMAKWQAANPGKDADTEGLRQQLQAAVAAHAAKLAEQKTTYENQLAEANAKFVGRDINDSLAAQIKAIPRTGGDENMQAQMLRAHLEGLYHIEYNPQTKKIELRDKANRERVVMNEAGTQILSVDQVAKNFLEGLGVAAKDTSKMVPTNMSPGAAGQHMNGMAAGAVPVGNMFNAADPLAAENAKVMAELGLA